ncbi:MAG: TrkH family potassium uptake protein [candidate division WOR-3 bacterium]
MRYFTAVNPVRVLVLSFLIIIVIGTALLSLPFATTGGISLIDALYTATSAVCVTGLIVKNTQYDFTPFGKIVILLLIQIGGLGYMTITTILILFFGRKASIRDKFLIRESTGILTFKNFRHFLFDIAKVVLLFEGIGAVLLFFYLYPRFPLLSAIFHSIFHSVSAFCNAGFSSFSYNLASFSQNFFLPLVVALLFISGGLGFLVWSDIYRTYFKRENFKLSLHSKIVLFTTSFLILFGTVLIFFLEGNSALRGYSMGNKILISFFHAVTPRTAGFNLVSLGSFSTATLILVMILMFIGASPGGTGGGIKTTTFFVSLLYPFAFLRNSLPGRVFKHRLKPIVTEKGIAVFMLSLFLIIFSGFLITLLEQGKDFVRIIFEIFSAFGTVGLSIGSKVRGDVSASYDFSLWAKFIIVLVMFCGRVGVINILRLVIKEKRRHFEYPEEEISIG